jgi:type IV secretory pathway VirB9-like protein
MVTGLLGAELAANIVKPHKEISAIATHSDEDAIVYNGDTKVVPRLTRRSKGSYEVVYDGRMVIPLWTKERFHTTVTLPTEEQILRVVAADGANWEILFINNSNQFYAKPRFPNSSTSINVITKSGNHYVFFATSNLANKNHEFALILDVLAPAWMQYGQANTEVKGGSQSIVLSGGQSTDISAEESERRCQTARQTGWNQAAVKHEDDLRDYATSIFNKANMDYKWSGNTKQLRLKRVFDDGRVTYLVFESSLSIQPAFWEIDNGRRKDVTVQRAVFSPEVMIVGKLFKDGVLSIGKGLEIKIRNRGWSSTAKAEANTQLRGDNPSANNEKR